MKIYCINLPERTDRLNHFIHEMTKFGMVSFQHVEAIKKTPGWEGCRDTYLGLFKEIKHENKPFIIFEDDIQILDRYKEVLKSALSQLPEKWDMLYLGGYPKKPIYRYSKNLFIAKDVLTTHAIVYNPKNGLIDYINESKGIGKIDVFFRDVIQNRFNCFITYPMIVTQYDNNSDICKNTDVSLINLNYKLYVH